MISSSPHCHVCCKDCPIAARLETYPYFIPGIFSRIFYPLVSLGVCHVAGGISARLFPMLQLVRCGIFCLVMEEKLDGWSSAVCTSSRRGTDPSVVWMFGRPSHV
jgi:hypothetical protein